MKAISPNTNFQEERDLRNFKACLHKSGGPQVGEITCHGG